MEDASHRMLGASLKLEALPNRPGAASLALSVLDGSELPVNGVNETNINDRERSRGWGLHLGAKTPADRLTLDAGYAVSRFENPFDPALAQGATLVSVR